MVGTICCTQPLSFPQAAEIFTGTLGRHVRYFHIPGPVIVLKLLAVTQLRQTRTPETNPRTARGCWRGRSSIGRHFLQLQVFADGTGAQVAQVARTWLPTRPHLGNSGKDRAPD